MAMVSQRDASKAMKKAAKSDARLARIKEEHKSSLEQATRTAVTMGGAFGMAWWSGRYPERAEILGMDASLVVGGALTVVSMMGWAGNQATIVESLGSGALTVFAGSKGYAMGKESKDAA